MARNKKVGLEELTEKVSEVEDLTHDLDGLQSRAEKVGLEPIEIKDLVGTISKLNRTIEVCSALNRMLVFGALSNLEMVELTERLKKAKEE